MNSPINHAMDVGGARVRAVHARCPKCGAATVAYAYEQLAELGHYCVWECGQTCGFIVEKRVTAYEVSMVRNPEGADPLALLLDDFVREAIATHPMVPAKPATPRGDLTAAIDNWFKYHAPQPDQIEKYTKLRDAAKEFALVIHECAPASADRTAAIRKVREAVMTANAAIACGGK